MTTARPRFSILMPVFNGMPYVLHAVRLVLASKNSPFELVVSDDQSGDDSFESLSKYKDSRLRLLQTPRGSSYSMVEHWEWLLKQANGDWIMFLGQDDGLQANFFELATDLADTAEARGLRTIASRRAEFQWPNGGTGVLEVPARSPARLGETVRRFDRHVVLALLSLRSYHFLPQMYTNSLWHKSLIDDIRLRQRGVFFSCHPQDANIAALGFRFEQEYLYSGLPLGWVGASNRSAGLAVARRSCSGQEEESLADTYITSVIDSPLEYPDWAGDFGLGENAIYFWQALRLTAHLGHRPTDRLLGLPSFIALVLAASLARHPLREWTEYRREQYSRIATRNRASYQLVILLAVFVRAAFVIGISIREAFRRISRLHRKGGVLSDWTYLKVADLPEVLPAVQAFGSEHLQKVTKKSRISEKWLPLKAWP